MRLSRGLALAAVLAGLAAVPVSAQTLTTGALAGVVRAGERPAAGVGVTLTDRASGVERTATSDGAGRFSFTLLPVGRYNLLAEQFGYRPRAVTDIPVRSGVSLDVTMTLEPQAPPVQRADTVPFAAGALETGAASGSWRAGADLSRLADPLGLAGSALALSSATPRGLELEGLPARSSRVAVDGVRRAAAAGPHADFAGLAELPFALDALGGATTSSPARADAEWQSFGGGLLRADPLRGPARLLVRGFADGSLEERRAGLAIGGPLVADTAGLIIGVESRRVNRRFGAPWTAGPVTLALDTVARDSFAQDLSPYLREYDETSELLSAFGRFDWNVSRGQALSLRAHASELEVAHAPAAPGRSAGLGSKLTASDVSAAAALLLTVSRRLTAEARIGVDHSERDWQRPPLVGTAFTDLGLGAGADEALPGRFRRTDVVGMGTAHLRASAHHFKGGFALTWTTHEQTYAAARAGSYAFAGPEELAARRGSFVQTVGAPPAADFSTRATALFVQDVWMPALGLEVLLGFRVSREFWPRTGVTPNEEWFRRTGIINALVPEPKARVSPRFAFQWAAGARRDWVVRGEAGLFAEDVDPAVLAEVISHDGPVRVRRALGDVGAWPAVPDSVIAPVAGPALALLHQQFESPRTGRVGLEVSRTIGARLLLHLGGAYRHTDYLPRRRDLNLRSAGLRDADSRPLFGTLEQIGSLVAARPGTNRRFADFDRVAAIDPSGYSDYWGVTVSLEREVERGLALWASYTFSRATDNWPGAAGSAAAQWSPFPDSTGAADWRDGKSDLDLPHRVAAGIELRLRGPLGLRIGALVRHRSGYPFTPGFREGVDLNGDGIAGNDPAFVSGDPAGAAEVIAANRCLGRQIGRFAERNSCRGPAVTSLDARVALRLWTVGGAPIELVVDGVNLVETEEGVLDRALYLVDRTGAITTDAFGRVRVPLVGNPNFGKLLAKRSPRAGVRAGLRVGF